MSRKTRKKPGGRKPRAAQAVAGQGEAPAGIGPSRRVVVVASLAVALFAALLYGRTASFGMTRTDDKVLLVDDGHFIEDVGNLPAAFGRTFFRKSVRGEGYYRPLVTASFMLDVALGGSGPRAHHVTNVVLHAACSVLVLHLLLTLGLSLGVSAGGTALFAAHPALVEAVAWIPGRIDVMMTGFAIGAFLAFAKWERSRQIVWLVGHGLLLFAALLTKEAAVAVPPLVIAWGFVVRRDTRSLRHALPWVVWSATLAAWFFMRQGAIAGGGTQGLAERLSEAVDNLPVLLMHLGKIVLPAWLAVLAFPRDTAWWPGAVGLVLVVAAVWFTTGERRRLAFFGLVLYALAVLPGLPVSDFLILENRLYLPAIGVLLIVLAAASELAERLGRRAVIALGVVCGLVVGLFAVVGWSYTEAFRDEERFTSHAVLSSPHLALAHLNRGIVLQMGGDLAGAEERYREALDLDATQPVLNNNLGLILLQRGEVEPAVELFRQEIAIDPGYDKAHYNLGLALRRIGRSEEAVESFRSAAELNPRNADAIGELMVFHGSRGDDEKATGYRRQLEGLGFTFTAPAGAPR